jgi:hypothetical protein
MSQRTSGYIRGPYSNPVSSPVSFSGKVFGSYQGRKFGSWITGRAGHATTEMIDNPAYIAESIFRDVLGVTDIDTTSFDVVGNTTNGMRKDYVMARSLTAQDNSLNYIQGLVQECGIVSHKNSQNKECLTAIDYNTPTITLTTADVAKEPGEPPLIRIRKTPLSDIRNEFYLNYKYNYTTGSFDKQLFIASASDNLTDNTRDNTDGLGASYQALCTGSQTRYNKIERWTFDANWIRADATAELFIKFMANWLTDRKYQIAATLNYTSNSLKLELADSVLWTHDLLPAAISTTNAFMVTRLVDGGLANRCRIDAEFMMIPTFFGTA